MVLLLQHQGLTPWEDGPVLYREMGKTGDKVSILGYGCMRFPKKEGRFDEARIARQVIYAIEQGVNYFDTAYIYSHSETILGKILAKGYRDQVRLATKLPLFLVHSRGEMESILHTQLKRLQTDHIDYYLMHAINSLEGWQRLKRLGVEEFLFQAQRSGKINHIGFSYHGDRYQFKKIIDDYSWDCCLIQYNYMDEHSQAGKEGLKYAAAKGIGVVVMEPLRGGLLASKVPPRVRELFNRAEVERTPAEWALRWVWNHPEVAVALSGMNEEAQIEENIRIAGSAYPNSLSAGELQVISRARDLFSEKLKVNCTGCGYCMPCPAGVNIPACFAYYNDIYIYGVKSPRNSYLGMLGGMDGGTPAYASLCRQCGHCEKHCPQGLPIRKHLKEAAREMERFYFKPAVYLARGYYNLRRLFKRAN